VHNDLFIAADVVGVKVATTLKKLEEIMFRRGREMGQEMGLGRKGHERLASAPFLTEMG
jgi:hypothetical protein